MPFFFLILMIVIAAFLKFPVVKGFFGELGVFFSLSKLLKAGYKTLLDIKLSDGENPQKSFTF